jgi:hypothetical protein
VFFIIKAGALLPKSDLSNIGYLIACSLMVFALLVTFSYLGGAHNDAGLALFTKPGFIYTCTIYALSLVAFDVAS